MDVKKEEFIGDSWMVDAVDKVENMIGVGIDEKEANNEDLRCFV